MAKERCPICLWLYRKIRKKANGRIFVAHSAVLEVLSRSIPWTPRVLYYPIIKHLEKCGLLRRIDKTKYEITGNRADNLLNQFIGPI